MSGVILDAVKTVAGPVKSLVFDRVVEYMKFVNSYDDNIGELQEGLRELCAKKLDLEAKVMKDKEDLRVMTRQTANWLESGISLIEGVEMKKLMKVEGVAEIVVKMMERRVLKNLWKEDREIFDIVVDVVKKKCSRQEEANDGEIVDAEEDADYKKVAKVASDVIKEISEEFMRLMKRDDAAVAVVKLLSDEDLKRLTKDGDEIAVILSKAEAIIRSKIEQNDDHEELFPSKHCSEDVQPVDSNMIKENVGKWRKLMGSLMSFLDDENFKKGLSDDAKVGLEAMIALSKTSVSDQVEANSKPHRHCGCCVPRFQVYRHHHDMSQIAAVMVNNIKSIIHKYPSDPVTRERRDDELDIIPGEFIEGLESREVLLRKIVGALQDDQVYIVGVYGMGGCGKTTLAKEIAHKRAIDLFDKRVVAEVSEAPSIKGIQNQIAGGIGLTLEDRHTEAQRARKLYNGLKAEKMKILIIFDNVWKKIKLDEVGIPHERSKDFCFKLLITTREKEVCRLMDVQEPNIFEVGLLNERESLNLFEGQTEKKVESGEFKPVADRLLHKCGGLPLAIATTASALKGKNLAMWSHFAETSEKPISSQVSSEYRETYSILETSYKLIDVEEKRIFLYLACLSPLDSAVTVDDLMRFGIGLDLFQRVNALSEAMEQANTWAKELVSSSLLLKGDSDKEVKIHDLVRASAISFNDKGNNRMTLVESIPRWMCKEAFEKFTAVSLMSGHDFSRLSGVKAPMLEILSLKGDESSTTLPSDFFVGMENLKVLSLSNMNFTLGLPESMGQLERLKTLHFHHCKLKDVKLIGKLVNLLVLSLRGSSLEELDGEIGGLSDIRLLDIRGCKGLKSIQPNILSRLSHLEGLYMLNSFDSWATTTNIEVDGGGYDQATGSELDKLSRLNVLEMEVSKFEQLLTINNGQLAEQLDKFRIRVCDSHEWYMGDVSGFRYVLELKGIDASPNKWLRALLKKADFLQVTSWDINSENLVSELDEDGFKNLKDLVVYGCIKVKSIINSIEEDASMAFANLEVLDLREMGRLETICNGKAPTGMFSNLRRLYLYFCPKLKYGLPVNLVPLSVSEVSINYCESMRFLFLDDASVVESETCIVSFPRLKSLVLMEVNRLSRVVGRQSDSEMHTMGYLSKDGAFFNAKSIFPSLESASLSHNQTIVTLWSKACDVSSFKNLKLLDIFRCSQMQSLGCPSIFAALVQLEELMISECNRLQEVISKETEGPKVPKHVINFPLLKRVSFGDCPKLKRFYGGSYELGFPDLKSLCLSNVGNLTNFDGSQSSATFFSDKIEFPCLEELNVQRVSNEVVRLWNWSSSGVQGESDNISLNPVPNLHKLTLGHVHGLTSIPHFVSHQLSHLLLNDFCDIETLFSMLPLNREVLWTYSQLPNLKELSVRDCVTLEQLFESEDVAATMLCGELTGIKLDKLPKLKILPLHLLKNIHTLTISELGWKYVFSAELFVKGKEQLQQLENLIIRDCKNMEVIIMDELLDGDGEDKVYGFLHLKSLTLENLNIANFASKPKSELHFPSLESIVLTWCYQIRSFWSGPFTAPKLKEVKLYGCENMEFFLSEKMNRVRELPSLENVSVWSCLRMSSFSSDRLVAPKLHDVECGNCPEMKWFLAGDPNNDNILELPSLQSVSINDCQGMQSFSSGGTKAPNLCDLKLDEMDYSKLANEELESRLSNWKECYKIREECEDEGDKINGGELEEIQNEGSQDEQNKDVDPNDGDILELPSLESVEIMKRRGMQSSSSERTKAPNLCEIEVDEEDTVKRLNDELRHLLGNLKINQIKREESDESDGGMEQQNEGSEDEQSEDTDEEVKEEEEEIHTE